MREEFHKGGAGAQPRAQDGLEPVHAHQHVRGAQAAGDRAWRRAAAAVGMSDDADGPFIFSEIGAEGGGDVSGTNEAPGAIPQVQHNMPPPPPPAAAPTALAPAPTTSPTAALVGSR